jgi:hypothetical protein
LVSATATARNASSRSKKKEAVHACVAAFDKAQELEKSGHLRQARDQWARCARPTCIAFFREECTTRYTQLDADIPSVVPVVTDESGATHVDVEVTVDGELLASKLEGRALQVDPGLHEFQFKADAGVVTQKIMIMQGQRNRPVSVTLQAPGGHEGSKAVAADTAAAPAAAAEPEAGTDEPPEPPPVAPRPRPKMEPKPEAKPPAVRKALASDDTPAAAAPRAAAPAAVASDAGAPDDDEPRAGASPLTWVLGAAGVAAVGASALMIYWGRQDNDMLSQCAPGCPPNDVAHIRTMYRAADISAGIGVAALAGSYLVYALTRPTGAQKPRSDAALLFDLQPAKAGAVAAISGKF